MVLTPKIAWWHRNVVGDCPWFKFWFAFEEQNIGSYSQIIHNMLRPYFLVYCLVAVRSPGLWPQNLPERPGNSLSSWCQNHTPVIYRLNEHNWPYRSHIANPPHQTPQGEPVTRHKALLNIILRWGCKSGMRNVQCSKSNTLFETKFRWQKHPNNYSNSDAESRSRH